MHPAEYHNEVSEHFENIFFMPFSWMVQVRPQNISAAHKAGISAQDFALAIGISGAVRWFPGHGGFAYLRGFRETVADVGFGEQVLGVRRVVFNLLA